jgi:hypothetical protein
VSREKRAMFHHMTQSLPVPYLNPIPEVAALAARYRRANGPVMTMMSRFGGEVETQMRRLPDGVQRQIEAVVTVALERAYRVAGAARSAPKLGRNVAPTLAAISGAIGGVGGLLTAIPELPVTVTLILHAIRREAEAEGFDPDDPLIQAECLRVFSAGSPLATDDGVNTAFLGARLALTGSTVQTVIRAIAPRLALVLGQKLSAQAVPVFGAVSGAAMNAAFLNYYRELAAIRFGLLRLAQVHGAEATLGAFQSAVQPATLIEN